MNKNFGRGLVYILPALAAGARERDRELALRNKMIAIHIIQS